MLWMASGIYHRWKVFVIAKRIPQGFAKHVLESLMFRWMATCIPIYRPGLRDGQWMATRIPNYKPDSRDGQAEETLRLGMASSMTLKGYEVSQIAKRIHKSLMVREMAKRIPNYRLDSRDVQAYPKSQDWFAGWPSVRTTKALDGK